MKKNIFAVAIGIFVVLYFSGCQTPMSGSSYERTEARKMQTVYLGTVVSVNDVIIQGQPGAIGTVTGAAAGAAIGHKIADDDDDDEKTTATIIGGTVGAVAGAAVEKKLTTKNGLEITVKLEDGRTIAVVQEKTPGEIFKPGDLVQVVQSPEGNARVRPR